MRTTLITMCCVTLAVTGVTNAFVEDFNSMTINPLAGQASGANTWAIPNQMTGTSTEVKLTDGQDGSQALRGYWQQSRGNSIAIDAATLAQIASGAGMLTVSMDMLDDPIRYVGLGVGTSSINDSSTPQNWLASRLNDAGLYDRFYSKTNGAYVDDPGHAITLTRATGTWKNFKIEVDLNASGVVTAAKQYIDGGLAGTWSFGATPTWSPTHVAFVMDKSNTVDQKADNFAYSWTPEPATLAVLLLGSGLALLRRRK